jgi:hypothetical protein
VVAHVAVRDPVVEEVAEGFAEGDGDEGGEVEEADGFGVYTLRYGVSNGLYVVCMGVLRTESVAAGGLWGFEEDRRGYVDADGPHKGHGAGLLLAYSISM